MKTYAVINQKGGIGKTTTAATLAAGLNRQGLKTLLIDMDAQGSCSYIFNADNSTITSYEVMNGTAEPGEAILHTKQGDIIPSSEAMATADLTFTAAGREYRLKEALTNLKGYKYVIIDTPPALSITTINALTAADYVIIPSAADSLSLRGIGQLYKTINAIKARCNPKLKIAGILLTSYEARTTLAKIEAEQAAEAAAAMNTKVFNTKIRKCTGIKTAQACRASIYDYKPAASVNIAVDDYNAFIAELIK